MNAIILGGNSDIGKEIMARLSIDGWSVYPVMRDDVLPDNVRWDLLVVTIGQLKPIGNFWQTNSWAWEQNFVTNCFLPLRMLRFLWPMHNPGASVCFFSGAGTSNSAKTYSAYSASKIALYKLTELIDDESPDVKLFILGPGMVRTKIQQQTLEAGDKAANYDRVQTFMREGDPFHGEGTSHDRIYQCMKWCMSLPKEVVGGRNVYVPEKWGEEMARKMRDNPRYLKLRREE